MWEENGVVMNRQEGGKWVGGWMEREREGERTHESLSVPFRFMSFLPLVHDSFLPPSPYLPPLFFFCFFLPPTHFPSSSLVHEFPPSSSRPLLPPPTPSAFSLLFLHLYSTKIILSLLLTVRNIGNTRSRGKRTD